MICDITSPFVVYDLVGSEPVVARRGSGVGGHIGAGSVPKIGLGDIQQGVDPSGYLHKTGMRGLKRRRRLTDVKRLRGHRLLLGLADRAPHQRRLGAKRRLRGHQLRYMSVQKTHSDSLLLGFFFEFRLLISALLTVLLIG